MNFVLLSIVYLILDILWISTMTPIIYKKSFESIQKSKLLLNGIYATLAYITLLYALYFICRPLSTTYKKHKWLAYTSVGFIIYAIYNFTNGAVFSGYSYKMTVLDIIWGSTVFSLLGLLDVNF